MSMSNDRQHIAPADEIATVFEAGTGTAASVGVPIRGTRTISPLRNVN
jgi:hypothetical protein